MSYKILKLLSKFFCMFSWNFCLTFGKILANVALIFLPAKRKNLARKNIKACLGTDDEETERIMKKSSLQFGQIIMEVMYFAKLKDRMAEHVKVIGLENVTEYLKSPEGKGRGAVMMTGHCDNWELVGGALAQNGIPLVGVAKKQKSEGADKFIIEQRTLIGMHITYQRDVREMYRLMDEGKFIGLIMDQDVGRHDGVPVKFFNRATNYVTGAASMSRFKKVPIFPLFMHKNPDDTHTLEIFPPLYTERTKDKREDIRKMTQTLATLTEEHIRKYPDEWFWLHDRWKSMRVEFTPEEVENLNRELGIIPEEKSE